MLDLSRIDMSEVDLELLAEAVAGVNRVVPLVDTKVYIMFKNTVFRIFESMM